MGRGGRRDPDEYVTINAEVYWDQFTGRKAVRPCAGEEFPQNLRIECAKEIREFKVDTKVRLRVVETDREGKGIFLYSSYKWPFELLSE